MFSLKLFGGASIGGPDGPLTGQIAQRRQLALLALLARAGRAINREKLVVHLWPDTDSERARHLLSDCLYLIHKALGKDAVLTAGDEILLNSAVVRSDVGEFEEALRQGDLERAVSVYQGPFLDGFRVKGAALEFERWADTERERLARSYANALERLAKKCAALGDSAAAVEWWRRLAAHDPYSGSVALGLMMALEAAGDRAGALRHARVYGALLRDDFAADPEPAVVALAARLRKEPAEARIGRGADFGAPSSWSEHPAIEGAVQQERHAEPVSSPDVAPAVEPVGFPSTPPPPPSAAAPGRLKAARGGTTLEFRPLTYVLLVLLALTILLALWDGRERKPTTSEGVSPTRIAVFPFAVYGSEEYAYLGEGLVDLLSTKLDGAGELHTVDPHAVLGLTTGGKSLDPDGGRALAHRLGAGLYVLGNVLEAGGQLQLNASLYDAEGRRKTTAQVVVKSEAQVFELIDRLAVQLLAAYDDRAPTRLTSVAAVTTTSLPALKAYLQGEQAFRRHRYDRAAAQFQHALELDSTFALAAYRLSTVAELGVDEFTGTDLATEAAKQAARFSTHLPPTDRMLVKGLLAFHTDNPAEAKRTYQLVLREQPSNVEGWYRLGLVEFHDNPLLGLSPAQSRAAFQRVLALDPGHQPARAHLAKLAARAGDQAVLDTILPPLIAEAPEDSLKWLHLRAFAVEDRGAQARYAAMYPSLSDSVLWSLTRDILESTSNFRGAQRVARHLTHSSRPAELREAGHLLLAWLELVHGRRTAAKQELAAVAALDPPAALEYSAVFAIPHFLPIPDAELRMVRDSLAAWEGEGKENPYLKLYTDMWPSIRQYLLALLCARLGDEEGVERHLAAIEPTAPTPGRLRVIQQRKAAVRARVAASRGDPATALALLEQVSFPGIPEERVASVQFVNFFERHLRPDLLRALGRQEDALRWYGAAPWTGESYLEETLWDWVYLAHSYYSRAQILDGMGRRRDAAEHYARFIDLWKDADPELRPMVDGARRRLAAIRMNVQPR